jgi:hypothetical protein
LVAITYALQGRGGCRRSPWLDTVADAEERADQVPHSREELISSELSVSSGDGQKETRAGISVKLATRESCRTMMVFIHQDFTVTQSMFHGSEGARSEESGGGDRSYQPANWADDPLTARSPSAVG